MVSFDPAKDIPSLFGKVILVTGGNIGLGKQCVLEYARHNPLRIYLAARSPSKAQAAIEEIKQQLGASNSTLITILELDLSSLSSVKVAAATLLEQESRLDILMLNAGIMAAAPGLTKDEYEMQFGVNYLGHALLFKLLHPLMEKTSKLTGADVRAIMVTSVGHQMAPKEGIPFDQLRTDCATLGAFERYGASKLAQILWARHAAMLYPSIKFAAAHPGLVGGTGLGSSATGTSTFANLLMTLSPIAATSVEKGARNQLWTSVGKDVKSGEWYAPEMCMGVMQVGVGSQSGASVLAKDSAMARKLWDWTEGELQSYAT
ncbi:retinol dehydrogenase 14 [Karstenula rhodostoma CBS 690.94]|uniref:Retinol dehydrogenase 14 n=1 Tax=Karstenula rhodostoma CBS 690.94 TaxID=1392251 RepID=A0A9P4PUR7_9PLEO|nr:retinol dehydrogenase 14 [Karstenula rhodostoma CBS 690.94]